MNILSKKIIPYFQPIVSVDTNTIYGYEVLGRYIDDDGSVKSLGNYFSDKNITDNEALQVDRIVREQGIKEFSVYGKNKFIFINMRLAWLSAFTSNPSEMPTLKWAEEYGISYSCIVIEITEEEFNRGNESYITALEYYKSIGCRIAIDDYGKNCSNIDRLAELSPDIIKIDMSFIHKSEQFYYYREYLKTISDFAHRLGIEVLYEGIETSKQLDNCITSKGRFYQGFLLSRPLPTIKNALFNNEAFKLSTFRSIAEYQKSSSKSNSLRNTFDYLIDDFMLNKPYDSNFSEIDEYYSELCLELPDCTLRIYLCNKYGYQISSNIERGTDSISITDYKNRNWAWRGYFKSAMSAINAGQKSFLTDSYRDATTKEKIYTYVRDLNNETFIFIDISKNDI